MNISSPLFPAQFLSPNADTTLTLPDKPNASSGSVSLYVVLAESMLFVQGFEPHEQMDRPPTVLRGALVLRVTKPVRVRTLTLALKGVLETDWPEGIPPKKTEYSEASTLVAHTWPFYAGDPDHGASAFTAANPDVDDLSLDAAALSPVRSRIGRSFPTGLFPSRTSSPGPDTASVVSNTNIAGTFQPGEYIYNFEHALPASTPETTSGTYGRVRYHLETDLERSGLLATSLHARVPLTVVRSPLDESLGETEPIHIAREWDDQLAYDIVVAAKTVTLNTFLPIAFKFTPLDKHVELLRIRVYVTESMEYYCRNDKVHRSEPTRKYLLSEHKSPTSLLADDSGTGVCEKEMEFQVYVPEKLTERCHLHPNTSFKRIQAHHWLKICLRLARRNPDGTAKQKHYEISIDSPINLLSPHCAHVNTLLPAYEWPEMDAWPQDSPLSPHVTAVDATTLSEMLHDGPHLLASPGLEPVDLHLQANLYAPKDVPLELQGLQAHGSRVASPLARPIHLIRRPSVNPPTFAESEACSGRASPVGFSPSASMLFSPVPGAIDALLGSSTSPEPPTYDAAVREGVHRALHNALTEASVASGSVTSETSELKLMVTPPSPPSASATHDTSSEVSGNSNGNGPSITAGVVVPVSDSSLRADPSANTFSVGASGLASSRPSVELRSVSSMTSMEAYERQVQSNQHSPLLALFGTPAPIDDVMEGSIGSGDGLEELDLSDGSHLHLDRVSISPRRSSSIHSSRRPSAVSVASETSDLLSQPLLHPRASFALPRMSLPFLERNQSMDITAMLDARSDVVWNPSQGAPLQPPQQPAPASLPWKPRQMSFGVQSMLNASDADLPILATMSEDPYPVMDDSVRDAEDPLSRIEEPDGANAPAGSTITNFKQYSMT